MTDGQCDFIEYFKTPLNACSLETFPPISWGDDGKRIWPLMLGCYELDESTGKRNGRLDFYAAPVPTVGENFKGVGNPTNVIGPANPLSGVLDGKWCHRRLSDNSLVYATAHASGEIIVHRVEEEKVALIGKSEIRDSGLCLSLAWDFFNDDNASTTTRIISSYSDGKVGIYEINTLRDCIEFDEKYFWDAHKMFRSPAEVWCANFTRHCNVVMTGGDEGSLKVWDLRAGFSPMHVLNDFSAGVTVISPHPRVDHLVACGSYDETVCIFDLRTVADTKPTPICHSDSVGGGLWRIKWHPNDNNRLLLGAMHGGCRIAELDNVSSESVKLDIKQEFTNHKSMAYGADWIVDPTIGVEVAASCSFYDRAFYAWDINTDEKH